MNISCGHCKGRHTSVQEVRDCSLNGGTPEPTTQPIAYCKPVVVTAEATEGIWYVPDDDQVYKVQRAIHGSGNLYAKLLVFPDEDDEDAKAGFEYVPGAFTTLGLLLAKGKAMKMTLEVAKGYGQLYGVCCQCGRVLTKETSIAQGMGDWCASKF